MTVTAFGPQGPNYSTTRPTTDAIASGGADTWFVPCSTAGATDGTYVTASWFNVLIANLRDLVRQAGVTLSDSDDTMVYQAVRSIAASVVADTTFVGSVTGSNGLTASTSGTTVDVKSTLGLGSRPLLT